MPTRDQGTRADISHVVMRGFSSQRRPLELNLTYSPTNPTWPDTTPNGTIVATVQGVWTFGPTHPAGLPFVGDYVLVNDDNGIFDIVLNPDHSGGLRISPTGPGVGGLGGTTQHVIVSARQV